MATCYSGQTDAACFRLNREKHSAWQKRALRINRFPVVLTQGLELIMCREVGWLCLNNPSQDAMSYGSICPGTHFAQTPLDLSWPRPGSLAP